jgi:hypothetical protein
MGSKNVKLNFTAFLPLSVKEYMNDVANDINKHTGCINTIEKNSTKEKYKKFTVG